MKINATISKKAFIGFPSERKINKFDASLIAISASIIIGILVGIVLFIFKESFFVKDILNCFIKFSTDLKSKNFFEALSGFLLSNLLFGLCLVFAGTSPIGGYIIYPIILLKSSGLGLIASYLIKSFKTSGMGYLFLSFLPGKIIFIFGLLILVQNCIQSSEKIKNSLNNRSNDSVDMKLYYVRAFVSIFILIVSALIDTTMLKMFRNFFDLPF